MKKVLIILAMMCAAVAVDAQTKMAHINSNELMEAMPEADSIQKKLLQEQEQWQMILAEKEKDLEAKYADFMTSKDNPNISKSVLELKAGDVEKLQEQYQETQKRAQEELQRKQQELLQPLIAKVKNIIAEVAKENGYSYVLDTTEGGGIIYSEAKFDLMPLVKAKLGLK